MDINDNKEKNINNSIALILESIANEEIGLSKIIDAEGEKLKCIVNRYKGDEMLYNQLERSCKDAVTLLNTIIMKEYLIINKLNILMDIKGDEVKNK